MSASPKKSREAAADDARFYLPVGEFFPSQAPTALTFDDVTLATQYSEVLPRETRLDTSLSDALHLPMPIISADMDTVTESTMAIGMALNGGLGLIHYNLGEAEQIREVERVKFHVHGLIPDPIQVSPEQTIEDVLRRVEDKRFSFRTFPVVDAKGVLVGLLPGRVVKERYRSKKVSEAMAPRSEVYTLKEKELGKNPIATADKFFNEHLGIHKLLVVDDKDRLRGLFTLSDIERITEEARANVRPAHVGGRTRPRPAARARQRPHRSRCGCLGRLYRAWSYAWRWSNGALIARKISGHYSYCRQRDERRGRRFPR